ncbi:MAG: hypothetical protein NTW51_01130 [Cyanobacteria bacterium]|nr:hypothetical protein [Cyanobacteriota bacterium]
MTPERTLVAWAPDRGDVIWIDHNPQAGREMKDHHPFGRLEADKLEQVMERRTPQRFQGIGRDR